MTRRFLRTPAWLLHKLCGAVLADPGRQRLHWTQMSSLLRNWTTLASRTSKSSLPPGHGRFYSSNSKALSSVTHSGSGYSSVDQNDNLTLPRSDAETSSKCLSEMPGPSGLQSLPYLGLLFLLWPFTNYRIETFGQLLAFLHDKYGPIFKLRAGKDFVVHTENLEDAEKLFESEGHFPQRRLMMLARVYRQRRGLPQTLASCNGDEWHDLRKPLNLLLNRPQAAQHYLAAQNKVSEDFVALLRDLGDSMQPQEIADLFFRFSSESIGVVCFNARLGFLSHHLRTSPEKLRLLQAYQTSLNSSFQAVVGMKRRYLKTERDAFYQHYAQAMDLIRQQSSVHVRRVMDNLEKKSQAENKLASTTSLSEDLTYDDDLTHNLLASLLQNSNLRLDQVLTVIDSLLIAGTDSTARNLSVLLYNLATHPEAQARAAEEVRSLIGHDGSVTAHALGKMNYLKACVRESMRIHFPVGVGSERILPQDTVLGGYLVPRGTVVMLTGSRTSLDPRYFPEPLAYKPERWLRQERSVADRNVDQHEVTSNRTDCPYSVPSNSAEGGNETDSLSYQQARVREVSPRLWSFAFLPFGHGPRSCVGRRLAEMELHVCVARVLQQLEVKVQPSDHPLRTIYTPFITPETPIPFRFKERT